LRNLTIGVVAAPVNLAPLNVPVATNCQEVSPEIRDTSKDRGPVLEYLSSSREAAAGMCRLVALIVAGEEGGEEIGVVGILCLGEALENRAHDVEPRTLRRVRIVEGLGDGVPRHSGCRP